MLSFVVLLLNFVFICNTLTIDENVINYDKNDNNKIKIEKKITNLNGPKICLIYLCKILYIIFFFRFWGELYDLNMFNANFAFYFYYKCIYTVKINK